MIPASPARCAEQLARGEADIGVIPSIEYQRIDNLALIPGISIAALKAVRSVILVRRPGREIRSVALDTSSRTSVDLLKLLLETRMGLKPRYVPQAPELSKMLGSCDAALLIGDNALQVDGSRFEVLDLAEAWTEWQKTPFVFAVWACRNDVEFPPDLVTIFREARDWGFKAREDIVRTYSHRLDLREDFLHEYLSKNVNYDLGPAHIEGLERFYRLAHEGGLTAGNRPLRFVNIP